MNSTESYRLVELIDNGPFATWGFFQTKCQVKRILKANLLLIAQNSNYQYFKIFDNHGRPWVVRWSKYSGHLIGAMVR